MNIQEYITSRGGCRCTGIYYVSLILHISLTHHISLKGFYTFSSNVAKYLLYSSSSSLFRKVYSFKEVHHLPFFHMIFKRLLRGISDLIILSLITFFSTVSHYISNLLQDDSKCKSLQLCLNENNIYMEKELSPTLQVAAVAFKMLLFIMINTMYV